MNFKYFTALPKAILIGLTSNLIYVHAVFSQPTETICPNEDVTLRFHAQWNVDEKAQRKLRETYGSQRLTFDLQGRPVLHGLTPEQVKRWERLYKLCMSDGCFYCDSDEGGSCESGTCGANNELCRPHLGYDGRPICGQVCADFAFNSILTCSDRS
jgi:hypothetical protein